MELKRSVYFTIIVATIMISIPFSAQAAELEVSKEISSPDISVGDNIEIFLKPGATDMRKQIRSLASYVSDEMNMDPLSGSLYIFCGKNRKLIKVLYWDQNGFCMWQKRLEQDKFPWPGDEGEARNIKAEELGMILKGIDFFKAHKRLFFSAVS